VAAVVVVILRVVGTAALADLSFSQRAASEAAVASAAAEEEVLEALAAVASVAVVPADGGKYLLFYLFLITAFATKCNIDKAFTLFL
jgi:hypothetical protein